MSVPYDTAVSTIQSMFDGNVEREVVCAVLEANNGHMERTVECLLKMSGELPAEEQTSSVSVQKKFFFFFYYWFNSMVGMNKQTNKLNLFLQQQVTEAQNQIREDELYARMLQNQVFMQQIRATPEFYGIFGGTYLKEHCLFTCHANIYTFFSLSSSFFYHR